MNKAKKFLMYTNPIGLPIALGVFIAIILKNVFSGVCKDTIKVAKKINAD